MNEPVTSASEARDRIAKMQPGERFCYLTGYLPNARNVLLGGAEIASERHARGVDALARFMLRAGVPCDFSFARDSVPIFGLGLGHLTQRKIGPFEYLYFFTKA